MTPGDARWLDEILTAAVHCNNADLGAGGRPHTGDPLEQALPVAGVPGGAAMIVIALASLFASAAAVGGDLRQLRLCFAAESPPRLHTGNSPRR